MKIVSVIGARPQFIKSAPLSKELSRFHEEIIIHTGQHYDFNMSDIFFQELEISKPNYFLSVGSGTHGKQTGLMLSGIEEILLKEKSDLVLVYGDTNSTLAGAISASKLHIPIAHVEAGLRSFNKKMPEEINRILTDHVSDLLFVTSNSAKLQLMKEGIENNVHIVGDIMYDAILKYKEIATYKSQILKNLHLDKNNYIVSTIHRAENTDFRDKLESIFSSFSKINSQIVLPLHPRTKKKIEEYSIAVSQNIQIIDPLGYLDMLNLVQNAECVFSDSGGLQKESYYLGVPCLVLREESEWMEIVNSGWNRIVGSDQNKILESYKSIGKIRKIIRNNFYGNGSTAKNILNILNTFKVN
jgi:UDP-GlcNAc3NAcA epimerase